MHHGFLLHHIASGISTPEGCCDFDEPDLSVALDVGGKVAQAISGRNRGLPR
jgi:hypothetical protein